MPYEKKKESREKCRYRAKRKKIRPPRAGKELFFGGGQEREESEKKRKDCTGSGNRQSKTRRMEWGGVKGGRGKAPPQFGG